MGAKVYISDKEWAVITTAFYFLEAESTKDQWELDRPVIENLKDKFKSAKERRELENRGVS